MATAKGARYGHTNLIARDWRKLAAFYEDVFGCEVVPPARDLHGDWIERASLVENARLGGVHLRLPGYGPDGPTLEIFTYSRNVEAQLPEANRVGYGHLAFGVDDVTQAQQAVFDAGGSALGDVVTGVIEGRGRIEFVYVRDPEGNIIELQRWF